MAFALVLLDDPHLRAQVLRAFRGVRSISATGITSADDIRTVCGSEAVDILVTSDVLASSPRLQDLTSDPPRLTLILGSKPESLSRWPGVRCLRVPFDEKQFIAELGRITRKTLDLEAPFTPGEHLQLLSLSERSGELVILLNGQTIGSVFVHEGKLWSASDEQGTGEAAFLRLLAIPETKSLVYPSTALPERNLDGDPMGLLLEAYRVVDENTGTTRKAEHTPTEDEVLAQLLDQGRRAILRGSLQEAAAAYSKADALRPNHALVTHALSRLRQMGFKDTA